MILDSLGLARPGTISALKKYLVLEARHKLDKEIIEKSITGVHIKAPLQPNHCDCGVYVLNYIETFFSNPDKYIRYCLERQTSRLDWFPTEDIPKKRIQITNLISEFTKRAVALGENKTNVVDLSDHSDVEIIE